MVIHREMLARPLYQESTRLEHDDSLAAGSLVAYNPRLRAQAGSAGLTKPAVLSIGSLCPLCLCGALLLPPLASWPLPLASLRCNAAPAEQQQGCKTPPVARRGWSVVEVQRPALPVSRRCRLVTPLVTPLVTLDLYREGTNKPRAIGSGQRHRREAAQA